MAEKSRHDRQGFYKGEMKMENIVVGDGSFDNIISSENLYMYGMKIIAIILIIVFGLALTKIIIKITDRALKKSSADPILYTFVRNVIRVAAAIIIATMCLGIMGIQIHTIIAVVGAAGAAIALALKDSLANIAGGVMIIITKPFGKDDLIDVGDVSGKVQDIDLFLTTLRTYDNKTITIPNGIVNTSILINHSKESSRRVDCTFGIGYEDDIGKAKRIMKEVCDANGLIFKEPEPLIGVANHGSSAVEMALKVWCMTDDYWDVKYYLEENIKIAFDKNGIRIPYPQMDVHIKNNEDIK